MRSSKRGQTVALVTVLGVLGASAIGMGAAIKAFGMHLQKKAIYPEGNRVVSNIPRETEGWIAVGPDRLESAEVLDTLGTQNYLNRSYRQKNPAEGERPERLELHLAYYTGMIDTVPHVPERCFVGGGLQQTNFAEVLDVPMDTSAWSVDDRVPAEFAGESGALYATRLGYEFASAPGSTVRLPRDVTPERPLRMRVSSFQQPGGGSLHAGYFFIANGGTAPNANDVRKLAFDLTSDYAFYLKVQVTSATVDSPEELAAAAGDLLDGLLGEIMLCVPDWVEVRAGNYPEDNPRRGGGA
ncbi:MAG: exosortase-associated EpsI family protein [Phycisphaerales bacterium]